MLEVRFLRNVRDEISGVCAEGHAQWDEAGKDIVCAAASVLLQSLWLGLTEVLKLDVDGGWESGRLDVDWSPYAGLAEVAALARTAEASLQKLAAAYPGNVALRG